MMSRRSPLVVLFALLSCVAASDALAVFNVATGRFLQRDPNATGAEVLTHLGFHGRALGTGAPDGVDPRRHFGDGMNTFQFAGSNPNANSDPLGLLFGGAATVLMPGLFDIVAGALESLVTDYAANLDWDADWSSDWDAGDDWHTRNENDWIDYALAYGAYDAFYIGIPGTDIGFNPLDDAYDLLFAGTKRAFNPHAPRPSRFPGMYASGNGPYSHLRDHPSVGPGKKFTISQQMAIFRENMARNGGRLRSDVSGRFLRRTTGGPNSAEVDHIRAKSLGGTNSFGNAQVVEAIWNQSKGNRH